MTHSPDGLPAPGGPEVPRVLILQHDPADPPMLLGDWLAEAGAELDVRRLHDGDEVPAGTTDHAALISLGGAMGAHDDEAAPWLPATRALLSAAVAAGTPTLGIGLGAQLLAVATGGRVERGADGPEIGAYLAAKRDAAEADPLFGGLPLSPDVMHFHRDVIAMLPPGGALLLSSIGYSNQAFRVGSAAWGIQFHIETTAAALREWCARGDRPRSDAVGPRDRAEGDAAAPESPLASGRCGLMLDEAEEMMGQVWRPFTHQFVRLAREGVPGRPEGGTGPRLPLLPTGPVTPTP